MLLIPELSVSPAMVLLSRASPGVSQTPSTALSAAPLTTRPSAAAAVTRADAETIPLRERETLLVSAGAELPASGVASDIVGSTAPLGGTSGEG
jgi:hypothetical protein